MVCCLFHDDKIRVCRFMPKRTRCFALAVIAQRMVKRCSSVSRHDRLFCPLLPLHSVTFVQPLSRPPPAIILLACGSRCLSAAHYATLHSQQPAVWLKAVFPAFGGQLPPFGWLLIFYIALFFLHLKKQLKEKANPIINSKLAA